MQENNKRIAKNTLLLYVRMFITMLVSLYTSRIVLSILGVVDFGIYNVVGGVVLMFSFLNNAMSAGTQRFLSFELGRNNLVELKKIFSTSLIIHILIALVVLILAETVGLWFFYTKLNIPSERMIAASWIYQFSIIAFIISIIQVPYSASIISHEKMGMFAWLSILDVILKLFILLILYKINYDKLQLYAILMLCSTIIYILIYITYCRTHFSECTFSPSFDKSLFNKLMGYSGWNLFGGTAVVLSSQGINILLNIFFGPVINAARGIAFQVNAAITAFVSNFQLAANPQIIKSYANGEREYMLNLIYSTSKYSFFLLFILALPILLETNIILHLWLKTVPDDTVLFCRLVIINSLIDCLSAPFVIAVQATGKIKKYQIIIGTMIMLNLPLSYIVLKIVSLPEFVFYISIIISIIALLSRVLLLKKSVDVLLISFVKNVLLKVLAVALCALGIVSLIQYFMKEDVVRLIVITLLAIIVTMFFVFTVGLKNTEKVFVLSKVRCLLKK
jgi:O-antigen/teichoic acid export membrane protein